MPENHGVPGSNPGPATCENPANSEKKGAPAALPEPLSKACQQPDQERTSSSAAVLTVPDGHRRAVESLVGVLSWVREKTRKV
jgi:hypothetical protein